MNLSLIPYDPFSGSRINQLIEGIMASHRHLYGSDLANALGYEPNHVFDEVIHSAIRACTALHITVRYHFLPIFRQGGDELFADWQLSRLAYTLIVMRSDLSHPEVAEVQLKLLHDFI